MSHALPQPDEADAAFVEAFLRAHPGWLAEHPALYRLLSPPRRVHGDQIADHMVAMVHAERAHAAAMAERADNVLAAGRAAAGLTARVQEAVLALLRSPDPIDCISHEMPSILGVDAVTLCQEARLPGTRHLPEGTIARLLEGRQVLFRDVATEARLIHAEAAGLASHDALVLIPGIGPPALLALIARDPAILDPGQGAGALAFLGRAVAASLGR
jgi:uncharacterized protein YigA (DUF484 family)